MNSAGRAFYGALCGAFLTLAVHPTSRPFLLGALNWGQSKAYLESPWLVGNNPELPHPKSPFEASMWMQAGATKVREGGRLSPKLMSQLETVALDTAAKEPQNAFWRQMAAVFQDAQGQREKARLTWIRAARCDTWDDYQSKRLAKVHDALSAEQGALMSWQYCSIYTKRSIHMARAIDAFSRNLLKSQKLTSVGGRIVAPTESLVTRHATLVNARLMRKGARSVAVGDIAATLIEAASFPSDLGAMTSPRKLILARNDLANAMERHGLIEQSEDVRRTFDDNDGWTALVSLQQAKSRSEEFALLSLLTACLPGALLVCSVFGAAIWGYGELMRRQTFLVKLAEPPIAPVLGFVLGIGVFGLTHLPLAAIAITACFSFLCFSPQKERSKPVQDLGLLFGFSLCVMGIVLVALLTLFITGLSTPGWQVMSAFNSPKDFYGGSTLFLGLSGIVLGLLLLMAPSWAMSYKISTPYVLQLAVRRFGKGLSYTCFFLALVTVPVAIYADGLLKETTGPMLLNEPVYYLNR